MTGERHGSTWNPEASTLDLDLHLDAHPPQHVHEGEAGRIQSDGEEGEVATRERGGTEEERGRGRVSRDPPPEPLVLERPVEEHPVLRHTERRPQGGERPLRVIPRRDGLDDRRRSLRRERGEEDGALHLGARDPGLEPDPPEVPPVDRERRAPVLRRDICSHRPQRLGHPFHRPP